MAATKVLTKHPLGKSGKSITRDDYALFKDAILAALGNKQFTHTELVEQLTKTLRRSFAGNISWYAMTVKLDLEARGLIQRTATTPQRYRLR